jgi:nucleotide-binding universal stress UspA family protein
MNILVGYKGTNVGNDLITLAIEHAKAFNGKIIIITSLLGGEQTTREIADKAEANLHAACKTVQAAGVGCETHLLVRGRFPGEDIVSFAEENDCKEVIIGVKSRSKVGKMLFGSTAQHVILHSRCPVVTVR